jgi:hypothetical protein
MATASLSRSQRCDYIGLQESLHVVRDSFKAPDWGISEQRGELLLTHLQTRSEGSANDQRTAANVCALVWNENLTQIPNLEK